MRSLCRSPNRSNTKFYFLGTLSLFILGTFRNTVETWLIVRQAVMYHEATRTRVYDELMRYLMEGDVIKVVQV
jgi:hypothetical protein